MLILITTDPAAESRAWMSRGPSSTSFEPRPDVPESRGRAGRAVPLVLTPYLHHRRVSTRPRPNKCPVWPPKAWARGRVRLTYCIRTHFISNQEMTPRLGASFWARMVQSLHGHHRGIYTLTVVGAAPKVPAEYYSFRYGRLQGLLGTRKLGPA